MQRFVNDPDYIVEDMVKGYVKAHKDLIKRSEANDRVVQYVNAPVEGKVGLVTCVSWLCRKEYDGCSSSR